MAVNASVGVFTVDRDLVIRTWDEWLSQVTGVDPESAVGIPLATLFPEVESRNMLGRLTHVMEGGIVEVLAPAFHHYIIKCKPLEPSKRFQEMQQHVTIAPLRNEGRIDGAVVTIEDVTQRVERERDLTAQLKSSDVADRLRAASELARSEETDATPLLSALGDADWGVRKTVVEGLAHKPSAQSNRALLAALRDQHRDLAVLNAALSTIISAPENLVTEVGALLSSQDDDLRGYAALGLGLMGDPSAIPLLIRTLDDPSMNVRFHAIEALGRLRAHAAIETLVEIAESQDYFAAFAAIDALAMIGDSSIATRLIPLLSNPDLREAVANALASLNTEVAVVPIAALLNQADTPAQPIAAALARLHRGFEQTYHEGDLIIALARETITPLGAERLLRALVNANDDTLQGLVTVLGWLEFDGVDSALVALIGHPIAGFDAMEALVRRGTRVADLLIRELENGNPASRKPAAHALGRIGSARAVAELVRLLSGPPDLIAVAASALGSIGDSSAFEPLVALLGHDQASVRQAAVSAINSIGHPETSARVNALLAHESPLVREAAAKIAGYFGFAECFERLLNACNDADERVRKVAVEHLVYFDQPRARAALAAAFESEHASLRAAAARAATQLPSTVAVPLLQQALRDTDLWVRYHAARALSAQRSRESSELLAQVASDDPAVPVRSAAIEALGLIGAPEAAPLLGWLALHEEREIAIPAIEALGPMADADGRRTLMQIAVGSNTERRRAALRALARRADATSIAEMSGLALAQAGSPIMTDAIEALARAGNPEAQNALIELTRQPSCRAAAVAALASLGFDAAPALENALQQSDEDVRHAAIEALARMKDRRATTLITAALDDPSRRVRAAAAQALARLDLRHSTHPLVPAGS